MANGCKERMKVVQKDPILSSFPMSLASADEIMPSFSVCWMISTPTFLSFQVVLAHAHRKLVKPHQVSMQNTELQQNTSGSQCQKAQV